MRIDGEWISCEDGTTRPIIRGEVLTGEGAWMKVDFEVDTAADRTVFSADVMDGLRLEPIPSAERIRGIGGEAASVIVQTQLRFTTDQGVKVVFTGQFSCATDPEAIEL